MGDTADVNSQHLAAMGLEGVSLGESYSPKHRDENRCPAIDPESGVQCAVKAGHTSGHARGNRRWLQVPVEVPEVKVDLTDEKQVFDLLDDAWPQAGGRFDILMALTQVLVEQARS